MEKITVRVPATTANIGPGFDSVGCALSLYNNISFALTDGLKITGCAKEFSNDQNLSYIGFDSVMKAAKRKYNGVHIDFLECDVPVSSGLGSSAALICAGAVAANHFCGNPFTTDRLLEITTPIEGHPDNLSPAFFGGMTASLSKNGTAYSVRYNPHPSLRFVALVPPFQISTNAARAALPKSIELSDAVYNISRVAVLLKAMETGDKKHINIALDDKLHQPYRRKLIKGYDIAERLALENGAIAFCISGAGPTCLALCDEEGFAAKLTALLKENGLGDWRVMDLPVDTSGTKII